MPFDIDIVPVLSRNVEYTFPPVGTLSSVAAYNFPMLEWLHWPAQALTGDTWWTFFLTLLIFNSLSSFAAFCLADSMFDKRAGLVAASLFTFSEVGISSSYTAWAQLLLPGFFVMTVFFLWEWCRQAKGIYLAGAGVIATAAFMTHFSALLLYPSMLAFALLTGAKWQWRWLLGGAIVVLLLFLPYLRFEIERDFVDLKAFVTQEVLVDPETMAQYEVYKPGYRPAQSVSVQENSSSSQTVLRPEVLPRWRRALDYALNTPFWYVESLNQAFRVGQAGFGTLPAWIAALLNGLRSIPMLFFWGGLLVAGVQFVKKLRDPAGAIDHVPTKIQQILVHTASGRVILLWVFLSLILLLMILTRTIDNASYLMGFSSIQLVMLSAIFYWLPRKKWAVLAAGIVLLSYATIQSSERFLRLNQHDDTVFSAYNVSIYRHIEAAVDYIAQDWQGGATLTVSYDILPEMPNLWWTPAWHSIDPAYRMGMNFDFLLAYHYGLSNRNTDPIGTVERSDYTIIYSPALARYALEDYEIHRFGAIVVLKSKHG